MRISSGKRVLQVSMTVIGITRQGQWVAGRKGGHGDAKDITRKIGGMQRMESTNPVK